MPEYRWSDLAEVADRDNSKIGKIVAALCKHNQGLPGGASVILTTDDLEAKPAKPAKKKRR